MKKVLVSWIMVVALCFAAVAYLSSTFPKAKHQDTQLYKVLQDSKK
jgi:hypothetical protein